MEEGREMDDSKFEACREVKRRLRGTSVSILCLDR